MIAGQRKRALLATLLLARNEWVSVDQLVDAVWNDDAPKSAYGSLKTYVWQLRTAFSGGREAGDALGTGPACYRLLLMHDELDVYLFEDGVRAGLSALQNGEAGRAVHKFEQACALWRATPFAELDSTEAQVQRCHLTELRIAAQCGRGRALLQIGANAQAIVHLRPATAEHPYSEELRELLMLALYRSGRQADALAVFEQTRCLLAGELGVDPGVGMRTLRQKIIEHSPSLHDMLAPASPPAPIKTRQAG